MTQTTSLFQGKFVTPVVDHLILYSFAKSLASSIPRILKEFKICSETDTVQRIDTVHHSRHQYITCHAQFVVWQVVISGTDSVTRLRYQSTLRPWSTRDVQSAQLMDDCGNTGGLVATRVCVCAGLTPPRPATTHHARILLVAAADWN